MRLNTSCLVRIILLGSMVVRCPLYNKKGNHIIRATNTARKTITNVTATFTEKTKTPPQKNDKTTANKTILIRYRCIDLADIL